MRPIWAAHSGTHLSTKYPRSSFIMYSYNHENDVTYIIARWLHYFIIQLQSNTKDDPCNYT